MSSLLERIVQNSTIAEADVIAESKFFQQKDCVPTTVPIINVALSGRIDGGLYPGCTMFAGPSKHFKSKFALFLMAAYFAFYKDAAALFYDSEFGSPESYFKGADIDTSKVLHSPLLNMENLKFDVIKQLEDIKRGDHLFTLIDSLGNVASKKELEDAKNQKAVTDMTRAKDIKSFFRMVTPYLNLKNVPLVVVNHTYETQEMYSTQVVSGGTGSYYNSDNIYIIGREQDKDSQGKLEGYIFSLNVEKSRYVKEKSKFKIEVDFKKGINRWSGLLAEAVESGHVIKEKKGNSHIYFKKGEDNTKGLSEAKTNTKEFWFPVLDDQTFKDFIEKKYKLSEEAMVQEG